MIKPCYLIIILSLFICGSVRLSSFPVWARPFNTVLFNDTFSDGNMDGWVIVDAPGATNAPSNWSVIADSHNYIVRQNSNIFSTQEGTYAYAGDGSWTDYHLEADVFPTDNDGIFVMFRYVDSDNYYRFIAASEAKFRRLEKKVNGVFTTIAEDTTRGYTPENWQRIHISMTESTIQVNFNYELIFSSIDTSFNNGKIAIGTIGSENCLFDNILVSTSTLDPYADAAPKSNIKQTNNIRPHPRFALGRPLGGADALPVGGPTYWIIFDMGEGEEIIDGEGNDLRIVEIGDIYGNAINEEHNVYASNSLTGTWSYLGQGMAVSEFDLRDIGLNKARYIQIQDLSTRTNFADTPGSDIDALQALNMENYTSILSPKSLQYSVVGSNVSLSWDSVIGAVNYNVYASPSIGSSNYVRVNLVPITTNFFTYSNPTDIDFFYAVTAIDAFGIESAFSTQVPYRIFMPTIAKK